jgi:hypothetical protein
MADTQNLSLDKTIKAEEDDEVHQAEEDHEVHLSP